MLQLKFIGEDKQYKPFTYQGKQFRPWYTFTGSTTANDLKKYLQKSDIPVFNYNDFQTATKNAGNKITTCLYCCKETQNIYLPVSQDILLLFNIDKFNKDNELVSEKVEASPIMPNYSIITKNKNIIELMQIRGHKIIPEQGMYGIITSEHTRLKKIYTPHIQLKDTIQKKSSVKTLTGKENVIEMSILDKTTKQTQKVNVLTVSSRLDNKVYGMFQYNKVMYFYEIWGDEKGKVMNTTKRKSNCVYTWGGPNV